MSDDETIEDFLERKLSTADFNKAKELIEFDLIGAKSSSINRFISSFNNEFKEEFGETIKPMGSKGRGVNEATREIFDAIWSLIEKRG